jgi:LacI family transcriptional regulator
MAVTIRDVAKAARVSLATVSRALNGKENVAEETRRHVCAVASKMGFVPREGARSLSGSRTHCVGAVLPDLHGEFFSELIRGIDATVRRSGYHLLVSSSHGDRAEAGAMLRAVRGRVDGLIVLSPDVGALALPAGLSETVPVVLLNSSTVSDSFDLINIENSAGAFAMVRHLHSLGHRRIAFIKGPESNQDATERLRGYRQAVDKLRADRSDELEFPGDFREETGHKAGKRILAMAKPPTAIFAANDAMAIGCLSALREAGQRVPEDFALAGFDDIPIVRYTAPPLTSVRVSIAELGRCAAERVLHGVRSKNKHKRQHMTLPTTLVVRDSSGSEKGRNSLTVS